MKNCVFICCNNNYISKSIVALEKFVYHNPEYDKAIIGSNFDTKMKNLCAEYNINLFEIDLNHDFPSLDKRPYGRQYPVECFYHFYAYKILVQYQYIVLIEPDIYTNKKLDLVFERVSYIGGTCKSGSTIGLMPAINRDYSLIKKRFGQGDLSNCRILGGLKVYNVANLDNILFYETIVNYYKESIIIGAPRCGDDSLMSLYQIYHNDHIHMFTPETHMLDTHFNNYPFDKDAISKLNVIHLTGNSKWWVDKKHPEVLPIIRYLCDNMIEFIYNNFKLSFIKQHLPEIYHNVNNVTIPFYYWSGSTNFGDLITPYFLQKYSNPKEYSFDLRGLKPNIISCGSIMRLCKPNTIVYGSGIRDIDQDIQGGIIQIVRGPLTRKRLNDIGCYCPPEYGDPGLLLPLYYNPCIKKKYRLGIIPHVIHYKLVKSQYVNDPTVFIVNLNTNNIEAVIDEILSCEKTISSSLHGLIISDAYNIPNKWVKFNDKIMGDDTKFYDYFQSVERKDIDYIDCDGYAPIPPNTFSIINNVDIICDKERLKNKMFFDENGIKNYTKYLYSKLLCEKIE